MGDQDINKERLELALEAAGLDLWENDLVTGEVTRAASKVYAELGYNEEESLYYMENLFKLVHPEDVERTQAAIAEHLAGTTDQYRCEFRLRARDGSWIWYANYGKVMDRSSDSPGRRFIGVTFNINDRRQLEAQLYESLELNQKITALSYVGILAYRADSGQCIMANEAMAKMVGASKEQLLGQNFRDIQSWKRHGLLERAEEVLKNKARAQLSTPLLSSFGREVYLDITMTPFVNHNEDCLLVMMHDISEVRKALADLEEARDRAEDASRAKSTFLANMSHEIRTPMNSILGMVQLALMNEDDPKQRGYLEKILHSGEHLLGVIENILDFSKIDAGKLAIEVVDFDFSKLGRSLLDLFELNAQEKGLSLSLEFDASIPARLRGDPLRLNQILINLVSNAIKFTEHGRISVYAGKLWESETEVLLRFEVSDTGIGMSGEQLKYLFTPFHQSDTSTSRKYGGTGLGLAICQRLVKLFEGEMGVESEPGRGSAFWFTARFEKSGGGPAVPDSLNNRIRNASAAAREFLAGRHILLADDHTFNQQVALEFLESAGAIVSIANNGEEALSLLEREPFDCVLMDVQMPRMDGLEATRQIRQDPKLSGIPIIALTANARGEDRENCLTAGMDDFIGKPFKVEEFYAKLAACLGGRA